jgi:hypothetical protein
MSKRYGSVEQRFWSSVKIVGSCWLWTGGTRGGYGRFRIGKEKVTVHRFSFALRYGPIAGDAVVRHKCDVPLCVNPDHLELGSHADNVADMDARGRRSMLHAAKLTEDDVARIRADNRTQRAIAKDYGVSHTAIGDIKRGKKWRHVEGQNMTPSK